MKKTAKIKIIRHLESLVEQGKGIAQELDSKVKRKSTEIETQAWITQVRNAFYKTFGTKSIHTNQLENVYHKVHISYAYQAYSIVGVIKGAIQDIEQGFLDKIEKRIEISVTDDILLQSKEILNQGNKDIAAILSRIILERIIKGDAKENSIAVTGKKTSAINDELKTRGIYNQPKWRQIQTFLDIGNSAAHGSFDDYDHKSVNRMIEFLESLLSAQD